MKFRLISRQGVDEGTGEIAEPFAGPVNALVWNGRVFVASDHGMVEVEFLEVLGQALDHHQVTPPPKVAERWTSPTAIGRMAEKVPDVVDSVAPGYVVDLSKDLPFITPVPAGDPSIAALVGQPRRRRGEPS